MSKRKLLLADDSITIQKVVNLTFADEGIEVITVGDGDAAMESINAGRPDIVLADVNMPGPNGYQICETLRAGETTRDLPVILLVGSFEPFDEAEAARVGANAYLTKPFQSIRQLVAQVSQLMESAAAPEVEAEPIQQSKAETQPLVSPKSTFETDSEIQPVELAEPATETGAATLSNEPQNFDDLGYPSSQPHQPAAPLSEDIDSLYDRSLSGHGGDDLSEIGIDDEMIETSYAAETAQQDNTDLEYDYRVSETYPQQVVEEASADLSLPDAAVEAEHIDLPAPADQDAFHTQNQDDPSRLESTIAYENWQPADMREADNGQPGDEQSTQPEPAPFSAPAVGEDTIRMDSRFDTAGSANFHFDETNLLDLETGEGSEVEITTPLNAIENGSNKQLVSLSPELIEMIAQRVVEKMSEKY